MVFENEEQEVVGTSPSRTTLPPRELAKVGKQFLEQADAVMRDGQKGAGLYLNSVWFDSLV